MNRGVSLIFIYFLLLIVAWKPSLTCSFYKYCRYNGPCWNFTSLDELTKNMRTECFDDKNGLQAYNYFHIRKSTFYFNLDLMSHKPLRLDERFDFYSVKRLMYLHPHRVNDPNIVLSIYNVDVIDLTKFNFTPNDQELVFRFKAIVIGHSRLKFEPASCMRSNTSLKTLVNGNTETLSFLKVNLNQKWCPFWFQGVQLSTLQIQNTRVFSFIKTNSSDLAANITSLSLSKLYKLKLDKSVLDKSVFSQLVKLQIDSVSLDAISPADILRVFKMLRHIELAVINLKGFFHTTNGTIWLEYLNYDVNVDIDNIVSEVHLSAGDFELITSKVLTIIIVIETTEHQNGLFPYNNYDFDDVDFCLFARFPHTRLVLPQFQVKGKLNCTCTLVWLLKYVGKLYARKNLLFMNDYYNIGSLCDYDNYELFNHAYESCDFDTRLSRCKPQTVSYHDPYFDMYDLKNGIIKAKHYMIEYAGPVASSIGLICHILIVATLFRNRQIKKKALAIKDRIALLDNSFYQYILANSIVSIVYCVIFLLDSSIACIPIPLVDYDFVFYAEFTFNNCLIKNSVISFVASTLKLLSNFLLIQISINRYVLIGRDHAKKLVSFSEIGTSKFVCIFGLVSLLMSIIVVFQQIVMSHPRLPSSMARDWYINGSGISVPSLLYQYDYYSIYFAQNRKINMSQPKPEDNLMPLVLTFTVIHDMFSYTFFCVLTLILDVLTANKLRETIKRHREMVAQIKSDNSADKAEIKSIVMIVMNSVVNFILRTPELLSMTAFIVFNRNPYIFKTICLTFNQCLTLNDLSNIFFLISMPFGLLFYLKFNTCFYEAFQELMISGLTKVLIVVSTQ